MKKFEVDAIIDFLRRLSESNNLDKVQIKDEKPLKSIYYCISKDDYLWIHIKEGRGISYCDKHISKDMELSNVQECNILYYFYKILEKKEEQAFNTLNSLCRYKTTDVE